MLGQNTQGLWVVRESKGQRAGIFCSREAALRFARLETADAVVEMHEGLEFDYAALHL
jgi:hypothetical protein